MKLLVDVRQVGPNRYFKRELLVHHQLLAGEFFNATGYRSVGFSGTILQRDGMPYFFFFNPMVVYANCIGEVKNSHSDIDEFVWFREFSRATLDLLSCSFNIDFTDARLLLDQSYGDVIILFPNDSWMHICADSGKPTFSAKAAPLVTSDTSEVG